MTPPLIDDRGFVLGQVNIIDGLAVQLGAAVAAAGVSFVAPDSATVLAAGIVAADLAALWALSRAPEPTMDDEPADTSDAPSEPADAEPTVVTLEVPAEAIVRVCEDVRADGGGERV